jgi:enoyl-[acyl-carrier protein] reductase II
MFDNRITRLLGIDIPIANAPMGGVAGPDLVSAVIEAGGMGLIPGSMGSKTTLSVIETLRTRTNRPFGVNIPTMFADEHIVDTLVEQGVRFVTTSIGPVPAFTPRLRDAGITAFHVVTSLDAAKRAADAGVDGLIVEGYEGGGMRGDVAMMVLLPLITSAIDLPVIAAGGISDGRSMAAAFALGAEGVQMGTRMVASAESIVHANFKNAIVGAREVDTVLIDRHTTRPLRVLRTATTEPYEFVSEGDAFKTLISGVGGLYRTGDPDSGFASLGQVSGRIDGVLPVAEIIRQTVEEFSAVIARLAATHAGPVGSHLTSV